MTAASKPTAVKVKPTTTAAVAVQALRAHCLTRELAAIIRVNGRQRPLPSRRAARPGSAAVARASRFDRAARS
jgi:hypothetical protein